MKKLPFAIAGIAASLLTAATAQWQNTTFDLKGGWNAIYLHGEATYATPDVLFAGGDALNIEEIWRWNPNPSQVQFTADPLIPAPGTPEWSVWYRSPGAGQTSSLSEMIGQSAYLVKCSGTAANNYSVTLKARPLPPSSLWLRTGANLLGFPSSPEGGSFPSFTSYFATFPAAIAANTKVFKYTGSDLGPTNPIQVFNPLAEPLDRNTAYWFEAEATGNFYAPLEITPSRPAGLEFGRTGSTIAVRIRNRTDATVTVTVELTPSASAPAGQDGITGDVPLTRRTFNTSTLIYDETPITTAFDEVVAPGASIELEFGLDRSAMSANSADFYASLLRFTDSSDLLDIYLPASARVATMAGLWVGDVEVDAVTSTVAGSPGDTTPRGFPLRYILHVDDAGTARLLSQVFLGTLDAAPQEFGICTSESALKADQKGSAVRIVAAHLPLDRVLETGGGSVALGGTLSRTINLPFDDKTNPFVHRYHPDHDNKDARFDPVGAGVESYTVSRAVSFTFAATPPAGTPSTGWGTTVLGGSYSETISGVHRDDLSVSGQFIFRRVNDIGAIDTTP